MNKNLDIKGVLFRWTPESAQWYEDASVYTGYHTKLTEYLTPYLHSSDTCCELACGTGSLARHIAPLVESYTANDADMNAIDHLKSQLKKNPLNNVTIKPGDWHEALQGQHFDNVIFSYYGAVLNDWEALTAIADKQIIIIAPRSSGKKKKSAASEIETSGSVNIENPDKVHRKNGHSYETSPAIAEFLESKNISYSLNNADLEFGQPFTDLDTAREYVKYYYKLADELIDDFLEIKLKKTDTGWFFPKIKEIGIIIADIR